MKSIWIFLLFFSLYDSYSQEKPEKVIGLPTNEIYDLHVDKKGYLWIGHALGISRYDGSNFINYSHPAQINLRMTNILEDAAGRIWYQNFTGQVFYIYKGITHLLKAYNYKKEYQTPKMALCDNKLLITSFNGLFVLNIDNFKSDFFPFERSNPTSSVSLSVIKNKAVVYNNIDWYIYGENKLTKTSLEPHFKLPKFNNFQLQTSSYNDTIYLISNPEGNLYKLKFGKEKLEFISKKETFDFINAVSVDKDAWLHTRNKSYKINDTTTINNYDLTDIVVGKAGNTWYGSRRKGLWVSFKPTLWKKFDFKIDKGDNISTINANAGYFFAGTTNGSIYVFDSDSAKYKWKLGQANNFGSIDFIRYINNDLFLISSNSKVHLVNTRKKIIEYTLPISGVFDVGFDSKSFYLATPQGVYVVPYLVNGTDKNEWIQTKQKQFPFFDWTDKSASYYLLLPLRTRSIRFDSTQQILLASTKNGLMIIDKKGVNQYMIEGKEVFSTSLSYKNGLMYIATVDNGFWIMSKDKKKHFTIANGLTSNSIIKVKATEDHLWIFDRHGIQVMNIHTNQIISNIDLPNIEGGNVIDVTELGNFAYLTTINGVLKIPLHLYSVKIPPISYLDYIIVNNKDTVIGNITSLEYRQNNVEFFFSSPTFANPAGLTFRYRLKGLKDEWEATNPGERMIRYSQLPHGKFVFEIYAVNNYGLQQAKAISFNLNISKPWWSTGWFFVLVNLIFMFIIYLIIQNRLQQKLKLELMRIRIATDLHDDIGATMSSLNFYIELAKSEGNKSKNLDIIKKNINKVIGSLDDLVWSINPSNDSTEQLLNKMQSYAIPFLQAAKIQPHFDYDKHLHNLKLDILTKRHLYLLFKEMINNVAKHSGAQNCHITLQQQPGLLSLAVQDDGIGINVENINESRNGFKNLKNRTNILNAKLEIISKDGKGSNLKVKIPFNNRKIFIFLTLFNILHTIII